MDNRLFWASEESGASSAGAPSLRRSPDYPSSAFGGFGAASWSAGPLDTAPGETPPSMDSSAFLPYGHALDPGSVASQAMYAGGVPPSHPDERAWMPPGTIPRRPMVLTPNAFAAGQRGWDQAPVVQPQMLFDGSRPDLYTMQSQSPHATQVPPPARAQYHDRSNEEITTLFIAGFPEDITEREFGNMFLFARGYEASMLKLPQATASARGEDVSDASTSSRVRQIIGFVKFRTRTDALDARDLLNGFRIDPERGSILKAELAKKNLHMKRQASLVVRPPEPYVQTPTSAAAMRAPWASEPSASGAAPYGVDELGERRNAAYARLGTAPSVSPSDSWSPRIGAQRVASDAPATAGVMAGDADPASVEGARTAGDATSQLGGLSLSGETPARPSHSPLPDWLRSALDTDEDPKARVRGPSRSLPEPRLSPEAQLPKQKSAPVPPVHTSPEASQLGESATSASSAPMLSMFTSPAEDASGPLQNSMGAAVRSPAPLERPTNPLEQPAGGANRLTVPGAARPPVQSPGALSRSPTSVAEAFAATTTEPAGASPASEDIEEAAKLEQEYVTTLDQQMKLTNRAYQEGFEQGRARGERFGVFEGRAMGREKGIEIWDELGYYLGMCQIWRRALTVRTASGETPTRKVQKQLQHLANLKALVRDMPDTNDAGVAQTGDNNDTGDQDNSLEKLLERIRARYKLVCTSLGQPAQAPHRSGLLSGKLRNHPDAGSGNNIDLYY